MRTSRSPGSSRTILNYYVAAEPSDEERAQAQEQADFVARVVRDEDYATGYGLQRALSSGAKRSVFFGRNEGGGQRFHDTLDQLLGAGAATSRPPSAS